MSLPWARLTRRKFAALAAAVPAAAQAGKKNRPGGDRSGAESTPAGVSAPVPSMVTADASLQKAYASVQKNSERLAQIDLGMDVEPAFVFRAAR